jgi:hypothetical protein
MNHTSITADDKRVNSALLRPARGRILIGSEINEIRTPRSPWLGHTTLVG